MGTQPPQNPTLMHIPLRKQLSHTHLMPMGVHPSELNTHRQPLEPTQTHTPQNELRPNPHTNTGIHNPQNPIQVHTPTDTTWAHSPHPHMHTQTSDTTKVYTHQPNMESHAPRTQHGGTHTLRTKTDKYPSDPKGTHTTQNPMREHNPQMYVNKDKALRINKNTQPSDKHTCPLEPNTGIQASHPKQAKHPTVHTSSEPTYRHADPTEPPWEQTPTLHGAHRYLRPNMGTHIHSQQGHTHLSESKMDTHL